MRPTVEKRGDSNNTPLWKKLGAGTAAALSLMLPSACTSDALPPAPGPTAVETTEQPKTQAEINQEIIDSYTIDMNIVPYDLLERFMKEMRLEHGSRPAEVHDVPEYWQEFQEPKERHDGMEMYELDVSRFDQFNINLKVLANILHVNRVNMGEEDYSDSNQQRIVKAAAQDVVGNMSLSPSEGEPDNNATKDVVVRAIRGFVQDVPADSVISNVEISLARVVPEDAPALGQATNDEGDELNTSIEELNLTARTANALINNDIRTVHDLVTLSEQDLRELKGFGSKALDEVKDKLAELEL
jgi:hypothetical protein